MAWDEWEQLKSEAAAKSSTGMRLNKVPTEGGGGGSQDLRVNQDDLGAVGHEAFILHDQLRNQADIAGMGMDKDGSGSTMQAGAALKSHSFALGSELVTTVSMWDSQLKHLLQSCAHISNHLNYSKAQHANDDAEIAATVRNRVGQAISVSELDKYYK
ncbi:hypothetical protein ACFS5L_36520 [Streptomyces phyllanthi]|uniref:AG1 protein n=1 Tax=Streptomyces phyllanthi TaxID=1803180 RepID=A0A5N8W6V6_9ACTN|nr:hypothetical protein [Streptomyces phyllanthi]MPY42098.1 hypothetical protein [Streptomyces phyllanthi]